MLSQWLEAFNTRMGQEGVPHVGRPLRAWIEWCRETGESFDISDPKAQRIFGWFEAHSPNGSLCIESIFTGAFFFDATFWPVAVPMVFGTQKLDARDALPSMPAIIKETLFRNADEVENFKAIWADCLDYGHGMRDLTLFGPPTQFWECLLVSGDRKLRSAVEDLCKPTPGENATQSSREACEMFLKSLLARNHGLTEADAKNRRHLGHDITKLLERILQVSPSRIFAEVHARLATFPSVDDRYAGKPYTRSELWAVDKLAQAVASETIRAFATRNTRGQIATRF